MTERPPELQDLGAMFSVDVVEAIRRLVDERVAEALAARDAAYAPPPWLTLEQAAERLACTPDAVRMRARRGRLDVRREGRRVYVSRASVDAIR